MSNLDWAIRYYRAGWLIFPCMDKKPYFQALQPWEGKWGWINRQSLTEEIVRKWWGMFPGAQIALKCGKDSGIAVIDIDWLKNPENGLPDVQGSVMPDELVGKLPVSPLVSTTGGLGKHVFYRHVDIPNSVRRVHPQMDVRSEGGYVILPPSVHRSGNAYRWDEDVSWSEEAVKLLPYFPTQALKPLNSKQGPAKQDWSTVMRGASQGMRNQTAASLSGLLVRRLDAHMAWDILELWNEQRNNPPLSSDELRTTFISIVKREYARRTKRA